MSKMNKTCICPLLVPTPGYLLENPSKFSMVDYQKNLIDCLSNVFGLNNLSPVAPKWLSSTGAPPPQAVCLLPKIWSENKRKISITIDPPQRIPGRKPAG